MRSHLAATLLLGALTQVAPAQTTVDPRLTAAVSALRPNSSIRVASSGTRVDGRFLNATSESLLLDTTDGNQSVRLIRVDTLWTRQRATGRGAVIGAVVGGVTLAALAGVIVGGLCESPEGCHGDYAPFMGAGLVVGGSVGAVLGATIGALSHRWGRRYP
jgi:hypothetical protein